MYWNGTELDYTFIFFGVNIEFSVHIDILFSSLDALQKKQAKNRLKKLLNDLIY